MVNLSVPQKLKFCSSTLFSGPSQKNNHSFLAGFSPNSCVHPACDKAILSQACDPVLHLQTLWTRAAVTHTGPPGVGRRGVLLQYCLLLGPFMESGHPTEQRFMVYGNTKQKSDTWSHCLQPSSPFQCLGTWTHLGTPILFVILGILIQQCSTWDSVPLCLLNTFQVNF